MAERRVTSSGNHEDNKCVKVQDVGVMNGWEVNWPRSVPEERRWSIVNEDSTGNNDITSELATTNNVRNEDAFRIDNKDSIEYFKTIWDRYKDGAKNDELLKNHEFIKPDYNVKTENCDYYNKFDSSFAEDNDWLNEWRKTYEQCEELNIRNDNGYNLVVNDTFSIKTEDCEDFHIGNENWFSKLQGTRQLSDVDNIDYSTIKYECTNEFNGQFKIENNETYNAFGANNSTENNDWLNKWRALSRLNELDNIKDDHCIPKLSSQNVDRVNKPPQLTLECINNTNHNYGSNFETSLLEEHLSKTLRETKRKSDKKVKEHLKLTKRENLPSVVLTRITTCPQKQQDYDKMVEVIHSGECDNNLYVEDDDNDSDDTDDTWVPPEYRKHNTRHYANSPITDEYPRFNKNVILLGSKPNTNTSIQITNSNIRAKNKINRGPGSSNGQVVNSITIRKRNNKLKIRVARKSKLKNCHMHGEVIKSDNKDNNFGISRHYVNKYLNKSNSIQNDTVCGTTCKQDNIIGTITERNEDADNANLEIDIRKIQKTLKRKQTQNSIRITNAKAKTEIVANKTAILFRCECGLHFISPKTIERHLQICPEDVSTKEICSKCGYLFTTDVLFSHLCKHHVTNYTFQIISIKPEGSITIHKRDDMYATDNYTFKSNDHKEINDKSNKLDTGNVTVNITNNYYIEKESTNRFAGNGDDILHDLKCVSSEEIETCETRVRYDDEIDTLKTSV